MLQFNVFLHRSLNWTLLPISTWSEKKSLKISFSFFALLFPLPSQKNRKCQKKNSFFSVFTTCRLFFTFLLSFFSNQIRLRPRKLKKKLKKKIDLTFSRKLFAYFSFSLNFSSQKSGRKEVNNCHCHRWLSRKKMRLS